MEADTAFFAFTGQLVQCNPLVTS